MLTAFGRTLVFALQDFTRNLWLSATTVVMLTLTVLSAHVLIATHVAARSALTSLERRADLRIQFRGTVGEADADAVRARLAERPEVASVAQRSRQEVLDAFLQSHRGDQDIADAIAEVGGNPFGPELRVTLRRPEDFPAIVTILDEPTLRERVAATDAADHAALTAQLTALTRRLRTIGFTVTGLALLVTVLIVVQAMRIVTYSRRTEASIMRLVGASNWFVRTPFLVFGALASVAATALATAVTLGALPIVTPSLQSVLGVAALDINVFFRDHGIAIALAEIAALGLVTIGTSAFAIRRYLRV